MPALAAGTVPALSSTRRQRQRKCMDETAEDWLWGFKKHPPPFMEETVEDWLWGFKKHPPPFISEPLRYRWKNAAEARLSP